MMQAHLSWDGYFFQLKNTFIRLKKMMSFALYQPKTLVTSNKLLASQFIGLNCVRAPKMVKDAGGCWGCRAFDRSKPHGQFLSLELVEVSRFHHGCSELGCFSRRKKKLFHRWSPSSTNPNSSKMICNRWNAAENGSWGRLLKKGCCGFLVFWCKSVLYIKQVFWCKKCPPC